MAHLAETFDELSTFVRKPEFWFATLLVGSLLSLVMAYIREYLDRRLISFTTARKERLEQENATRRERVRRFMLNPAALLADHAETQMRLNAALMFALTGSLAILGAWDIFVTYKWLRVLISLVWALERSQAQRRSR